MTTLAVAAIALLAACPIEHFNKCKGANPHPECFDDAGAEGEGEGEGEGEVDAGGEGEGEGECPDRCEAPQVCDSSDECVVCYDAGSGTDPGCSEGTPVCTDGPSCVTCVDTGDVAPHDGCGAGAPYCVGGACAACRANGDCVTGDAIFCDPEEHICRSCEADAECSAQGLGAACLEIEGLCVQCDDAADCGGDGCDPRTNTCSPNPAGTVGQCQSCLSDLDCQDAGAACVVVSFPVGAGDEVGTYCALGGCEAQADPDFWCSGTVGRGNRCLSLQPRDGELAASDFCVPAVTTCEAYLDAGGSQDCAGSDECGAESVDDAVCIDDMCTYACPNGDADCPPFGQSHCVAGNCRP